MIDVSLNKKLKSAQSTFHLNISFKIEQGKFLSIFGPSGAGKTTLLRLMSGLDKDALGHIKIGDITWLDSDKKINLSPQKRNVGMVFQNSALFPNMTVLKNLEYALLKEQSKQIINELIDVLELKDIIDKKTQQLSGGQKQKVALARALVQKPKLLLLDEPLSVLDDDMRFKLQDYILKIHKKYNLTTFLISHNVSEVLRLSDEVIKIEHGKLVKHGKPNEVLLKQKISGKYQTIGHITSIKKADVVYIVSVLTNNSIVKIVATNLEIEKLKLGDKVMVASKAFNPVIFKI
ncbi:MAG TPA: ATP-binding cassette domain-containing protein [Crocinitomix sp.]|nr:ATP-binding cassette domain-containing protein [Crocinitomix sp.]